MNQSQASLQENIRLYPLYQIAGSFLPWLPLFFLYFNQYVSLSDALVVSAVYYFLVFILEIPSGYLSDRFGRKPILIFSSLCAMLAYAVFLLANSFQMLVLGQCLLAGFFAFKSGSDTALLYDSLVAQNRQDEYASQEASAAKLSMLSLSAAGLVGGVTGFYHLHIAYALSFIAATACLYFCIQFKEPENTGETHAFLKQLRVCIGYLRMPVLLWVFGYFVLAYSMEHVPAEFNQPYVKLLQTNWFGQTDASALVSGIVIAISMLTGALAAALSIQLLNRLGLRGLLMLSLSIQSGIVAAMALVLHPIVLITVMFRNFAMALTHAPMLNAIAPHIASKQRATYLSIQSLAGRLGFSILLYSLSKLSQRSSMDAKTMDWSQLSFLLRVSLVLAVFSLVLMFFTSRHLQFDDKTKAK